MGKTKETKHTPRPWGFGKTHEGQRLILGNNGEGGYVCNVQIHQTPRHMGWMDEEEREANAQLIKAAPDMLGALKECIRFARQVHTAKGPAQREANLHLIRVRAETAIAKAEGQ